MAASTFIKPYAASYAKPNGPGDSRPTALQIIKDYDLTSAWAEKTIFITGVSSGIGVETAKALATTNATLYLTARNLTKARTALGETLTSSPKVHLLELDQTSLTSVRACAEQFLAMSSRLDILILNAGIRNTPKSHTADGFEQQFEVNHLSHFLLLDLLTPTLLASSSTNTGSSNNSKSTKNNEHDDIVTPKPSNSRVVILSSSDHRNFANDDPINWADLNFQSDSPIKYTPARAYTQSKLANVYTATEANRRYAAHGLNAYAVMPGGIMTGLQQGANGHPVREILTSPKLWTSLFRIGRMMKSAEQGAASTVWAAVATELEGITVDASGGVYIEDCGVSGPVTGNEVGIDPGYGVHAFDKAAEKRMWKASCDLVQIQDRIVSLRSSS